VCDQFGTPRFGLYVPDKFARLFPRNWLYSGIEVTDRSGGFGWKPACEELVIPRFLCGVKALGVSSVGELKVGPFWFTGLLARGL
jgi:hypothetical protein